MSRRRLDGFLRLRRSRNMLERGSVACALNWTAVTLPRKIQSKVTKQSQEGQTYFKHPIHCRLFHKKTGKIQDGISRRRGRKNDDENNWTLAVNECTGCGMSVYFPVITDSRMTCSFFSNALFLRFADWLFFQLFVFQSHPTFSSLEEMGITMNSGSYDFSCLGIQDDNRSTDGCVRARKASFSALLNLHFNLWCIDAHMEQQRKKISSITVMLS